jgi:cystathionine gamma-synthase
VTTEGPGRSAANATDTVHAGVRRRRPHHTLAPSIAQTATFTFDDTADLVQYMEGQDDDPDREEYGRYGNPTVRELERRLASLEGAEDCMVFSSGMAAITNALMMLLKTGDHVVLFDDCYRRTRQLVGTVLSRFGISQTLVAPGDLQAVERAITPETRLLVGESPTNPYLYCTDLEKLAAIAKRSRRIRTLVDSTFATPINCRPHSYGIDLVVHSATKYIAGHNDVLGGSITGPAHLISLMRDGRSVFGSVVDPHAAFLIGRGLKTLALRVERQNRTALAVAQALETHPKVERVFYPFLPTHPSYAIAKEQMRGGGGVVSFIVAGGRDAASRVVDGCRLATIAPSLGGVETLIEQPALMSFFELSAEQLEEVGIHPALIRLSVGIEETDDVVRDITSAMESA